MCVGDGLNVREIDGVPWCCYECLYINVSKNVIKNVTTVVMSWLVDLAKVTICNITVYGYIM